MTSISSPHQPLIVKVPTGQHLPNCLMKLPMAHERDLISVAQTSESAVSQVWKLFGNLRYAKP
jgi:hypothetical protein